MNDMTKPYRTRLLYTLDGKTPVECNDVVQWALEHHKGKDPAHGEPWRVGLDTVGGYKISTVFLGIDHAFDGGTPILFETMMFGPDGNVEGMGRSATYEIAEARHREVVERVRMVIQAGKRVEEHDL